MKIKKEFVDLIYNKEKQYEFRNSGNKEGVYKIKNKHFELKKISYEFNFSIREEKTTKGINYYFCRYEVTEQEYNWIINNIDYFKDDKNKETYIVIYIWKEVELKELEVVE